MIYLVLYDVPVEAPALRTAIREVIEHFPHHHDYQQSAYLVVTDVPAQTILATLPQQANASVGLFRLGSEFAMTDTQASGWIAQHAAGACAGCTKPTE